MHARIMLFPGSPKGNAACEYAEQLLTDISAAFDHSFSLLRGKLEPTISDQTLESCENSQGLLLGDALCPNAQSLYDALGLPLRIRSFCVPEALCGRHERPVKLWFGTVLSLDEDTLRAAMAAAFAFAREEDARILYVAPGGRNKAPWEAAVRAQSAATPLVHIDAVSAPDAVAALVTNPGRMGLLLCPPYAGSILEAAIDASFSHPEVVYDLLPDDEIGVYAPCASLTDGEDGAAPLPFATAQAVARLLRVSLHLPREGACLEAAVQNVMANHAHAADQEEADPLALLELIGNQIAVAGELMSKGGIMA